MPNLVNRASTYPGGADESVLFYQSLGGTTGPIKAAAGKIYSLYATNANNLSVRYLQIFNNTASVASGAVATESYTMPQGTASGANPYILKLGNEFFGANGSFYNSGIAFAISTVASSYAPATATEHNIGVHYV